MYLIRLVLPLELGLLWSHRNPREKVRPPESNGFAVALPSAVTSSKSTMAAEVEVAAARTKAAATIILRK